MNRDNLPIKSMAYIVFNGVFLCGTGVTGFRPRKISFVLAKTADPEPLSSKGA